MVQQSVERMLNRMLKAFKRAFTLHQRAVSVESEQVRIKFYQSEYQIRGISVRIRWDGLVGFEGGWSCGKIVIKGGGERMT